jgi:hypothetical protein
MGMLMTFEYALLLTFAIVACGFVWSGWRTYQEGRKCGMPMQPAGGASVDYVSSGGSWGGDSCGGDGGGGSCG